MQHILQQICQLRCVRRGRQTTLSSADNRDRFVRRQVRKSFFQRARESRGFCPWSYALYRFAEAKYAMRGQFERLCHPIVRGSGDDNLQRVMRKKRGCQPIRCSE